MTTVLVAGSGSLSQKEADDLIDDFFSPHDGEVILVAPGDRKRFTKAVKAVVESFSWDEVILVVPEGESKAPNLPSTVTVVEGPTLHDVVGDQDEELDLVLIAVPDSEDDDDYDEIVQLVDACLGRGVAVKDLTKALDDIRLEDTPAEEEPVQEDRTEPETEQEDATSVAEENLTTLELTTGNDMLEAVQKAFTDLLTRVTEVKALLNAYVESQVTEKADAETVDPDTAEWEDAPLEDKPRKRGRPRTNVTEKQIEKDGEWTTRPRGRVKKGTATRVVNTETGEVTEEGIEGE